jgi:hypothetical protein
MLTDAYLVVFVGLVDGVPMVRIVLAHDQVRGAVIPPTLVLKLENRKMIYFRCQSFDHDATPKLHSEHLFIKDVNNSEQRLRNKIRS